MEAVLNKEFSILVADDDEDLLTLMKWKMKAEGFGVQIFPNAEKIFDMIETDPPDIILLDIAMRGVNGGDICKQLKSREKTKHIPVIMLSANLNIEKIARECGADDYIAKPFQMDEVKQKLWSLAGGDRA